MRVVTTILVLALTAAPAAAITGNAPPATGWTARPIVMVTDGRGDLCTGTALAPDLVLTAAHCVAMPFRYEVKAYQTGGPIAVRSIVRHPSFNLGAYAGNRATADVALVKLASPLPDIVVPAALAVDRRVEVGDMLTVAGFGVTAARTDLGLGIPRTATLTVTGKPGSIQIRLMDPRGQNRTPGLGACTGDSGGPAFDGDGPLVIGVISWSTAAENQEGCGGLTGITPLINYRKWIVDTAKRLGSPIAP